MNSPKRAGRIIGLALLTQLVLAPPVYFRLVRPGTAKDFLLNAAANAAQIRIGLLLTLVLSVTLLAAAIAAFPVFRRHGEALAMTFFALAVVNVGTLAMESVAARQLLLLSIEFANSTIPRDLLESLAAIARPSWISAHYTNLVFSHSTIFVLYLSLYRFALVPRPIAVLGLAASSLSTVTVTSPLAGNALPFNLVYPLGAANLVLLLWLLGRGLSDRPAAATVEPDLEFVPA